VFRTGCAGTGRRYARTGILNPEVLMALKDEVGRRGEDCAAEYLLDSGYTLLDRNWRCEQGEIDLIAARDG
jgi:hypothetical protein